MPSSDLHAQSKYTPSSPSYIFFCHRRTHLIKRQARSKRVLQKFCELSELQLWEVLTRIAEVQHDNDADADKLQRDSQPLLRWSAPRYVSDNLVQMTGDLVVYLVESDLTSEMMDEDASWLKRSR